MTLPIIVVQVLAILLAFNASHGQERPRPSRASAPAASCDQFLPAPRQVGTRQIGPEACAIVSEEVVFNGKGQPYERRELRITGTVTGWAAKQGPRFNYFNDAPDFVYAQSGNTSERFQGIGRYSASTGHGISLFLPADPAHWNGKLFVTAHGAGPYAAVGALLPRHPDDDPGALAGVNRYVALMLDRGYAVAHTLRSSHRTGGDVTVTLEDGTSPGKYNVSSHAGFITDFARIATNVVQQKLGRKPAKTHFYGFSAGGFLGRLFQYHPGFNVDPAGGRQFDGFLLDAAGAGLWLPVRVENGRDTLFLDDADRDRFVPQIDVTHQLYMGETGDFLDKKLQFLRIGYEAVEITGCWANVLATGAAHKEHCHPNNFLSGAYYVRTHPRADTINFHDPRTQANVIRPPVVELTSENTDQVVVKVQNGTLLLFPAYLPHSVDADTSEAERINLSFNLMFSSFTETLSKPLW